MTLAVVVAAMPAFAQFTFDAQTNACVDAHGQFGLNPGARGPCGDLRGLDLDGADLSSRDLRGAHFDGASLKGASLMHSNLRGASFERADLTRAVLTGAKLERASLAGTRLVAAHLEHAVLTQAVLSGADVRNACLFRTAFGGADLRNAQFSRQRSLLSGARWSGAVVTSDTLPFDAQEQAALELQVQAPVDMTVVAR